MKGLLLPYQIAWLEDRSQVAIWEKSRRIGASFVDALKSVLTAAKGKADGGADCYYLSYNKDMTEQYIRDAAWWAKKIGAAAKAMEEVVLRDEGKDILVYQIRFNSGRTIQALPSNARNIRSKQGRIILDEAAFVDEFGEILKAALAMLMWGGSVAVMSTHNGVDSPFNELIEEVRAGRYDYHLMRTTFDEALEQGLYKVICRAGKRAWTADAEAAWRENILKQYGEAGEEELFCVPRRSGGAFIPLNLIEAAMVASATAKLGGFSSVLRVEPPAADFVDWPRPALEAWTREFIREELEPRLAGLNPKQRHVYGFDVGRVSDLTVLWVLAEEDNLDLATPLVIEMARMPFKIQEAVMRAVEGALPRFSGAAIDAGGIGASLAEAARQEWGPELVAEVKFSESWYEINFPLLKARFEDKALSIPKDTAIRDDLRQVKVIGGRPKLDSTRRKTASGTHGSAQRHGDAAVALVLADFALRRAPDVDLWAPVLPPKTETSRLLEIFGR